jgi:hypothetical protein
MFEVGHLFRFATLKFLPTQTAIAAENLKKGRWCGSGPLGTAVAAWQSLVGQLNRLFVLHEALNFDTSPDATPFQDVEPTIRAAQWLHAAKAVTMPLKTAELFELRFYTLFPGRLSQYVPLLLNVSPAQEKYSQNVGIWTAVSGNADQLVHLWAYKDAMHRAEVRSALSADPKWNRFVPQILPMIRDMESYFLMRLI